MNDLTLVGIVFLVLAISGGNDWAWGVAIFVIAAGFLDQRHRARRKRDGD